MTGDLPRTVMITVNLLEERMFINWTGMMTAAHARVIPDVNVNFIIPAQFLQLHFHSFSLTDYLTEENPEKTGMKKEVMSKSFTLSSCPTMEVRKDRIFSVFRNFT